MPESLGPSGAPDTTALVERLVRESGVPGGRERDDLRRELLSHFEDAGMSPEAREAAIERFGDARAITSGFRQAYRRGRRALYIGKVLAAISVSSVVALVLQALVSIALSGGAFRGRSTAYFIFSAIYSIAIVLAAVAAWELGIEPLCERLERRPMRFVLTFVSLFAAAHVTHSVVAAMSNPAHDFAASIFTMATWMATIAILARLDLVFLRLFGVRASR